MSPEASLPLYDVKTVDAKKSVKIVTSSIGIGGVGSPAAAAGVVEAEQFNTPEGMQASTTAVTTAVKTPCFITYVDSVNNSPAASSEGGGSPPTVPATVDTPGSAGETEKAMFRNVATPATAKKVKKVRAKGVTLFDETSSMNSLDLDLDSVIAKADPIISFGVKNNTTATKTSLLFTGVALVLFTAAFLVNSHTASLMPSSVPKNLSANTRIVRLKESTIEKIEASKVLLDEVKLGAHVVVDHFKAAFRAALSMEFDELSVVLSEM